MFQNRCLITGLLVYLLLVIVISLSLLEMSDKVEEAFFELHPPALLGEGPIYRFSDHTLHFNDCFNNKTYVLPIDPSKATAATSSPKVIDTSDSVSVQYFRKNNPGSYICLYYQGIAFMDEKTGALTVLKEIIPKEDRSIRRFNDGAVDPSGRFWGGEIDKKSAALGVGNIKEKPIGRLWRYDPDGSLHQMDEGFVCSNGIGWSPDLKTMYLNDSVGQKTFAFDYDNESGNISKKRILRDYEGTQEEPDGLVVDVDGNIWSAMWGGYRAIALSPTGEIVKQVSLPPRNVTCPTWGGADNDTLFFTSASAEGDKFGGNLFKYKTNTKGMPKYEFAG